ncbi:MAG: alpha/beta hydrolase family protein [Candidatus Nanohalobium sp.]
MTDHFIEVEDGEKVAATYEEADSEKCLFICHGFGGNKERQQDYIEPAVRNGFNAVTLDFRGNGESDGDFIEQDLSSRIEDLKAAVKYFDPEEVYLFGTSFGGKVVFHAAPELKPEAVVGKAPVTYNDIMSKFREVIEEKGEFEYIPGKPIDERFYQDMEKYDFPETASKIKCPVAIFHGAADTTVHPENSFEAAQEIDTDVMVQKFEGEKHSFSEEGKKKLLEGMFNWLNSL